MRKSFFFTSCLTAATLAIALPASAQMRSPQPRPERPYRGLFGGGVGPTSQQLVANFSIGGGYDDDLSAEAGNPTSPGSPSRRGGPFGSANTGLSYSLAFDRVSVNANYGLEGRLYRDLPTPFLAGQSAGAGVSVKVTESFDVTASTSVAYQPFYSTWYLPPIYDLALGSVTLADPSVSYYQRKYFSRSTGVSAAKKLTGRTSISGSYNFSSSGVVSENGYAYRSYGASLSHGIANGLSARLGYYANEAFFADVDQRRRERYHTIDAGLDYTKSLSLTRRTRFSFGTGTGAVNTGETTYFTFLGNVNLTRELGRTWSAGFSANRWMQMDPIVRDVTISEGISVGVGGLINQRVQVQAGLGTSRGWVGLDNPNKGFGNSSASASLSYGITRNLGVSVQYTYYYTRYDAEVVLPIGWPRNLDRQSFSANLNLWAPLFTRTRRPNASR